MTISSCEFDNHPKFDSSSLLPLTEYNMEVGREMSAAQERKRIIEETQEGFSFLPCYS